MSMTWAEFKQRVEASGVRDDDSIVYIDWDGYYGDAVGAFMFGLDDGRCGKVAIDCDEGVIDRSCLDGETTYGR